MSLWDAVGSLDFKLHYTLSFLEILTHTRPVPEFRPDLVLVGPLADSGPHQVWPLAQQPKGRRASQPGPRGRPKGRAAGQRRAGRGRSQRGGAQGAGVGDIDEQPLDAEPDRSRDALVGAEPDEAEVEIDPEVEEVEDMFPEIDAELDRTGLKCPRRSALVPEARDGLEM